MPGPHLNPMVPIGPQAPVPAVPVAPPAAPVAPPIAVGPAPADGSDVWLQAPDGRAIKVASSDLPKLAGMGYTPLDPAAASRIEAQDKHRGVLSGLGAVAQGAIETLAPVVGPAAEDVTGLYPYADQRSLAEARPVLHGAGQAIGAVAPAIATLGGSAPASAAGAGAGAAARAAAASAVKQGAKYSAPEVIAALGGKVAAGAEASLGANSLGRITAAAANMATQSAAFAASDWANRATQGDPKATGEQLFHQTAGAILFGAPLGALAGTMSRTAAAHADDFVAQLRDLEARSGLKATGAIQGLIGKWEKQVGPERLKEIGRFLGEQGGVGKFKSFEEMLELAETRFKAPAAAEMEAILQAANTGKPGSVAFIDEVFNRIWQDPVIQRWRRDPLDREAFAKFKGVMDELLEENVVRNADGTIRHYTAITPDSLHKLSQSFANKARGYAGTVDPSSTAFREAYDAGRVAVNERLEKLLDDVSAKMPAGGDLAQAWKAAKFKYQSGLFLEDGATLGWKRSWGNNQISPMEAIGSLAGAIHGEAPGAALVGTAVGIARREGSALQNEGARRLANFLENLQTQSGQKLSESISRIFRGAGAEASALVSEARERHQITADNYAEMAAKVHQAAQDPEHVAQQITRNFGPLVDEHGDVALALQQTASMAAQHLARQFPDQGRGGPLDHDYVPSASELATLNRHWTAVHSPETVLNRIADGSFTDEDASALAAVYPSQLPEMKAKVAEALAEALAAKQTIPRDARTGLAQFLGVELSGREAPLTIAAVQEAYGRMAAPAAAAQPKDVNFKSSNQYATATQARASRLDKQA